MRVLLAALLAGSLFTGLASAQTFQEGTHYRALPDPVSTVDSERIEVREFFSYGCPFCNQFLPRIKAYEETLDDDVVVVRHPVVFSRQTESLARAYVVAEQLDVVDQVHGALFVAYHDQGNRLGSAEQVADVFEAQGVERQQVLDTWDSFGVETNLNRYQQSLRRYMVSSTPSMAVNGRYYITMDMAGSQEQLIRIVDFLVQKERNGSQ
ncbi:MAG: thiol:disulfide interchange protein DsbA/DsbL [Ectothiorhodospiraceae bacterium]|nr:thiol:disulfide interchange protein DsbA/DsbL [Ectothiorhodospiraceae bacterium]